MANRNRLILGIGGVRFAFAAPGSAAPLTDLDAAYLPFTTAPGAADVEIEFCYGKLPDVSLSEENLVFDSGGSWGLYEGSTGKVLRLYSRRLARTITLAFLAPDYRSGRIYRAWVEEKDPPTLADSISRSFGYPLAQVWAICYLARNGGMLAHACGIKDGERGYLFVGRSGDGKSTIAQQWSEQATVLNDDRIVIRPRDGQWWMYGTPWHGTFDAVSAEGARLERIFFLRHGPENSATRREALQASTGLLVRSFPPYWDSAGMENVIRICHRLAEDLPCDDLTFAPTPDVVNFVRGRG